MAAVSIKRSIDPSLRDGVFHVVVEDPGEGGPHSFWSKLRSEGRKKLFLDRPPPPYLRVWMTAPPPSLSEGLDPPLCSTFRNAEYSRDGDDTSRTCSLVSGLDFPGALTFSA